MGKGHGFGKVIMFGEHFVVHGVPGIASATSLSTEAIVKKFKGPGLNVIDNRKGTEGYTQSKKEQQKESLEYTLKAMSIDLKKNPMEITLGGDLPVFSGIGASAASAVAIARAISDEFRMNLSDERINEIAYEAEKAYAGNPSGIDNTAATYGGLIWFMRGAPSKMERLKIKNPVEIVMGNSGVVADTKEVVAGVAERKQKNPQKYDKIFKDAEELVHKARKSLERFDLKTVGELMNENQKLLQEIEVSGKELDFLVKLARDKGAWGAKLTGGGVGGCMVALTPRKELQEKVASAMEKEGFKVLRMKIG
ncbi:MAG: mevalonate kinase [Candidatus Aenigmarchaeota archaeon]|nr:mevalonate kinase [Candidatus Aenigmarchaeota archaeon]